jgi:hypothetical protein
MAQAPPHYPRKLFAWLLLGAVGLAMFIIGLGGATGWVLIVIGLVTIVVSLPAAYVLMRPGQRTASTAREQR